MSLTLTFAFDDGALVATPSGSGHPLTTLRFLPNGLAVSAASCSPVVLDWDSCGNVGWVMDGGPDRDGWAVVPWTAGRGGPIGLGVRVSGRYEESTAAILSATNTLWRRLNEVMVSVFAIPSTM